MDRYWFLTSTTYGTWMPGDRRGFVSRVMDDNFVLVLHNLPGEPYDADMPELEERAIDHLKGPRIFLGVRQALALLDQFRETAAHRGWWLVAVAIMANHFHLVVGVEGDPEPSDLLRDFKSYGSRKLNRSWGRPESDTWWTESGSKRKLKEEANVLAAVDYIREQKNPLVIWIAKQLR